MANKEHLALLKLGRGVAWNRLRKYRSEERPDLSDADLKRIILIRADLSHVNLSHTDLSEAFLHDADLSHADLSHANLSEANLSEANLSEADLSYADLNRANLSHVNLGYANLRGAQLRGADLSHTYLSRVDLRRANLSNAKLHGVDLSRADLSCADLSGAILINANLIDANLCDTNLIDTILSEADLSRANLSDADLRRANLEYATVGWTVFADLDLRPVTGLETLVHLGPSTIGVDTIVRSEGNISEVFLRGAGVPETFITYARSLVNNPIEYYTCFISYSSKDQAFVQRLHNDLQANGVRCWYAPEDMNIGDKIRPRIDESIRLYDKLLVILSENSIASDWVAYEVERALNKEPKGVPNVLYPIRLDNAALACDASWAQDIRETRHIGDFEQWKDHDHYQEGFKRLLRALTTKRPTKET